MLTKDDVHKHVRKLLKKDFQGYVLITCTPASKDGKMQVEMSYDGDPVLAAYMMEGAQQHLDSEDSSPTLKLKK